MDDAFPRYEQLIDLVGSARESEPYEYEAARHVISMCQNRALVCDVENRAKEKLTPEQLGRITKADLVVLDYHLTPGDETDVRPALSILQTLADSDHANLVIIYTKHDLKTALRDVFVRFRGIDPNAALPAEYDATDLTQWVPEFDAERLFAYLADRKVLSDLMTAVSGDLKSFGVQQSDIPTVTRTGVELWLQANYAHVDAPKRDEHASVTRSSENEATPWLHYKNVFIAFVSKTNTEVDLIDALEAALTAWDPGVLHLVLSNARNRMLQRGFGYEQIVVGSPDRQVGLLYHALGSEEPNAAVRLQDMLRRLFDSVRQELAADSAEFGARLINRHMDTSGDPPKEEHAQRRFYIEHARAMAHVQTNASDARIIGALNAFLCSRPFDGSHLFAGTVFKGDHNWWLCAAPSCEIVPREPKADKTWHSEIHPCVPMQALRLEEAKSLESALESATDAKHIFISFEGRTLALRVLEENSGQPKPETLFLQDAAGIDAEKTFKAYAVEKGPELRLKTFCIVAQLRSEYADRFLHQAGHHGSRIGVDFVRLRGDEQKGER